MVAEENKEEERVKDEVEALTLSSMSPSNIMTNLISKNFRTIQPCW